MLFLFGIEAMLVHMQWGEGVYRQNGGFKINFLAFPVLRFLSLAAVVGVINQSLW